MGVKYQIYCALRLEQMMEVGAAGAVLDHRWCGRRARCGQGGLTGVQSVDGWGVTGVRSVGGCVHASMRACMQSRGQQALLLTIPCHAVVCYRAHDRTTLIALTE
eukprot:357395-Chlamydomonas_euryale.AAC.3